MDKRDLHIFNGKCNYSAEHYWTGVGKIVKSTTNEFGTVFEVDSHPATMFMLPINNYPNIELIIDKLVSFSVFPRFFQRDDKTYTQAYVCHLETHNDIGMIQNIVESIFGSKRRVKS